MSAILFEVFKDVFAASMAALVFVIGQGILRFIIEPAADLRKVIAEIGFLLIHQAHVLHTPGSVKAEFLDSAQKEARRLAALLESRAQIVPFLGFWAKAKWLPSRRRISSAKGNLIFLSNNTDDKTPDDRAFIRQSFAQLRESLDLPEFK